MNTCPIDLAGARLQALGSGALWWPGERTLTVSDLHLGKSERMAQRSGSLLPPYETLETLTRLASDLDTTRPARVICLGDSFDDRLAEIALPDPFRMTLAQMMAGRDWIWIEGNHDPGPTELGGSHLAQFQLGPLVFRHIAETAASGEVSGHYHPKFTLPVRGRSITRAAFLHDCHRIIMPAYGTYTGGLRASDPCFEPLLDENASAVMTGLNPVAVPRFRGLDRSRNSRETRPFRHQRGISD